MPQKSLQGITEYTKTHWWTWGLSNIFLYKGWEPTFLIRVIGLSEKPIIGFGSVLSDIGLKSQNIGLEQKKNKKK